MKLILAFFVSLFAGLSNYAFAFFYANSGVQHFAKTKFGMIVVEMRNALGGHVFSRNRGGAYTRTKVTPLNPQSPAQQAARALLSSLSQGWRSITAAQRLAWNAAADNFPSVDVFGDQRIPSGQQLYVGVNTNITNGGGAIIADPPVPVGAEATGALGLTATDLLDVFTVAYANSPVPAGTAMLLEATEGKSAGVTNFNSHFRVISVIAAAAASPFLGSADYVAKFGPVLAGLKYACRGKYILLATGEVSVREVATAIAT